MLVQSRLQPQGPVPLPGGEQQFVHLHLNQRLLFLPQFLRLLRPR
jgi:hypothetical protein